MLLFLGVWCLFVGKKFSVDLGKLLLIFDLRFYYVIKFDLFVFGVVGKLVVCYFYGLFVWVYVFELCYVL